MPTYRAMRITDDTTLIDGSTLVQTPTDSLASLDVLLGRLAPHVHQGGCTVILGGRAPELLGFPATFTHKAMTADHPALNAARDVGWKVSKLRPWVTFWRPGRPSIHVGIEPWLSVRNFPLMNEGAPNRTQIRLCQFHELVGVPYHGKTSGLAGIELLREHHGGKAPRWVPDWSRVPAATMPTETVYAGWRSTYPEHTGTFEHEFDARLQFLSAATNAVVAVDQLHHRTWGHNGGDIHPGYYRITVPPWAYGDRIPHPVGNHAPGTDVWVTGATLALLFEVAEDWRAMIEPEVHEAWVAPGTRVLRKWGERIRDAEKAARGLGDVVLHREIKQAYKSAVGLMQTGTARVRRPDWAHTIVGLARANLWRKLWREGHDTGRWPIEINADAVWYRSTTIEPDRPAVFPDRPGPGGFTHQRTREVTA